MPPQSSKIHPAILSLAGMLLGSWLSPMGAHAQESAMPTYVGAMQPCWNLGNTLDAVPKETSWGNPLVTRAFIRQIADQGFQGIRIPVTSTDHTGPAPTFPEFHWTSFTAGCEGPWTPPSHSSPYTITYPVDGLPAWASINASAGLVSAVSLHERSTSRHDRWSGAARRWRGSSPDRDPREPQTPLGTTPTTHA